jgi:hypothetical protein
MTAAAARLHDERDPPRDFRDARGRSGDGLTGHAYDALIEIGWIARRS